MECRILECKNCTITQGYNAKSHIANDMVARINGKNTTDYITAHSDGKVIARQTGRKNAKGSTGMASYGNYVQIQHSNGYTTFYAHLSSVSVKVGQTVKKGQRIGYMGDSGNAYGAHLHFEVRKNSTYASCINPSSYVNADLPGIKTNTSSSSASYYKKCASNHTSIVNALNSIGVNSSFSNRSKIAKANGIKVYVGTASQNIKLLNLLKQGKLKK